MTASPPTENLPSNPDRREEARVSAVEPCLYQLARFSAEDMVEFADGYAVSLNSSRRGLLLLMPELPKSRQVFEVHILDRVRERTRVKLVETCWTRELTFGPDGNVYLVGVKALFEPRGVIPKRASIP